VPHIQYYLSKLDFSKTIEPKFSILLARAVFIILHIKDISFEKEINKDSDDVPAAGASLSCLLQRETTASRL